MRHHLYRWFDCQDVLLYVGISLSAFRRASQHMCADWHDEIAKMTLEHYPSKQTALAAETHAIKTEHPKYNVAQNDEATLHRRAKREAANSNRRHMTVYCNGRIVTRSEMNKEWKAFKSLSEEDRMFLDADAVIRMEESGLIPMPEGVKRPVRSAEHMARLAVISRKYMRPGTVAEDGNYHYRVSMPKSEKSK